MTDFQKVQIEKITRRIISELFRYGYRADREGRSLVKYEGGAAFSVVSLIVMDNESSDEVTASLKKYAESFGKTENGKKICREFILIDPENLVSDDTLSSLRNLMKDSGTVGDVAAVDPFTGKIRKDGRKNFVQRDVRRAVDSAFSEEKVSLSSQKDKEKTDFSPVYLLIAANVTLFFVDILLEFMTGNRLLTELGVQDNALILKGEFWRLFTPMFLHADIFHLLGNMLALRMLGKAVIASCSKKRFCAYYFLSGLVGNVLSFFFVDALSLGASGAVMGLGGVMIYLILFSADGKYYRSTSNYLYIVFVVLYNLIYGLLPIAGNVNNFGHFGGFAAGFLLAAIFSLIKKKKADAQ